MKKFVTNFLALLAFSTHNIAATSGAASEFDGLYYPKGTRSPSSCERIRNELHPNGMIIEKGIQYHEGSVCKMLQPRNIDDGTEHVLECEAEGEPYRTLLTVKRISMGLDFVTQDGTTSWVECRSKRSHTKPALRWTSGYAQGVSETTVTNAHGNSVTFSCGEGTTEPLVNIDFESNPMVHGPIDIVIDDQSFFFTVENGAIKIDTNCQECLKNYGTLMLSIFKGHRMAVQPPISQSMTFDLSGAKDAFNGQICENAGHLVKAAHRPCELTIDGKIIHSGACSRNKDDTGETIIAVNRDTIVMFSYNNDGKTAVGYWNGPTGVIMPMLIMARYTAMVLVGQTVDLVSASPISGARTRPLSD